MLRKRFWKGFLRARRGARESRAHSRLARLEQIRADYEEYVHRPSFSEIGCVAFIVAVEEAMA